MGRGAVAGGKSTAAAQDAWLVFEDETGQNLRPPKAHTWGPRGRTPVVKVSGGGSKRVSVAGLLAVKPGAGPRMFYRMRVHRGSKGGRKAFTEREYIALLDSAHQRLGGPLVVVWDNLNTHVSVAMRRLVAARPWLTTCRLPAYAPELNPVEAVWSHLKRSLANLANRTIDELADLVRSRLRSIQHRPDLAAGFLASTGLDFRPPNPSP